MDEEHEQKRKSGGCAIVVLLLLLVAYPASTGPLVWLGTRGHLDNLPDEFDFVVAVLYSPLTWTMENVPGVFDAMQWYFGFWTS